MNINAGDEIIITKSYRCWEVGMDKFVGRIFTVTKVIDDDLVCFDGDEDYPFRYSFGHFEKWVDQKRPLVFSASFYDYLLKTFQKNDSKVHKLLLEGDKNLVTGEEVSFITFRTDGMISFLPKQKEPVFTEDGKWALSGRQQGRPAKVIRKLFTQQALNELKETDFERFCNHYKSSFSADQYYFEILPNNRIPDVYNDDSRSDGGSLGASCMNGSGDYMDIYANHKDVSILCLRQKEGDQLMGRALLWKNVPITIEDTGEKMVVNFLDRFYVAADYLYGLFIEYAEENSLWYKSDYKSYDRKKSWINPSGDTVDVIARIELKTEYDYYPYIDTFTMGGDGWLSNDVDCDHVYVYNETGGAREDNNHNDEVYDAITDCYIDEDDAVRVQMGTFVGDLTHFENTVTDNRGRTWWNDDDGVVYSRFHGEHFDRRDVIFVEIHDDYIREDEVIEVNGIYYHVNDEIEEDDEQQETTTEENIADSK